ncbi:MAG TPA: TIGR01244 family phosphatase [Pusillimonas sp.]|nr:TIGR01244 family phosphatase [Pusillimonas sp.]
MAVPVNPLTDSFSVAPQLSAGDLSAVAQAGYKSVIINRPDFEGGPEQPASQEVIQAAKAAGLEVVYQPVVSGAITAQDVSQFAQLLNSMPKPILAYCRSGTRCTQLFQAASTS